MMLLHEGLPLRPHDTLAAWTLEPAVILTLGIGAVMYARGSRIAMLRSTRASRLLRKESLLFAAGWSVLAVALVSPLHSMGGVLFSAHMVQHELMMTIAAPLLVLGNPVLPLVWSLPARQRRAVARAAALRSVRAAWSLISRPFTAWLLHGLAIWIWHAPRFYDASVTSEVYHTAQHATFLLTALLFWWSLLRRQTRSSGAGLAVIYLFTTAVHTSLLGALLAVSENPLYTAYTLEATSAWGMSPVEDQQLGGIIMWVPGGLTYLVAALVLMLGWMKRAGERALLTDRLRRASVIAIVLAGACSRDSGRAATALTGGDADRGRDTMRKYGCQSCHSIPGVRGAAALVGPNLDGIASRSFIAGVLTNNPVNMMQWLRDPPSVDDKTAMPNLGVTEKDARDIAAYLYTLQ